MDENERKEIPLDISQIEESDEQIEIYPIRFIVPDDGWS